MENWQDYAAERDVHSVVGSLKYIPNLWSPQLENERAIFVWLPESYAASDKHYPVIYMHDGQNLFDVALSFCGEWGVDETLTTLGYGGIEAIVVGIPNLGTDRCNEYSPFSDLRRGGGCGDDYLDFIVHTLKPIIDRDFRTLADREHTGIFGSSMGGLISLYAAFSHAETFGLAGVMSPSLWFANRAIFPLIQRATSASSRIYLDAGTAEGTWMLHDVQRMATLLRAKGLGERMIYVEAPGAHHTEAAWAERLSLALIFLLRGRPARPLPVGLLE
ncbi:MAG: alpha/beta hydrolase [Herpetosiphonaceae bacterium]|nr:alpha/beta hydrolase [Herpetosiphonaceae bacterium]